MQAELTAHLHFLLYDKIGKETVFCKPHSFYRTIVRYYLPDQEA